MVVYPDWLRKYWALLLAAVLVGFFGYRLWPTQGNRGVYGGALVPGVAVPDAPETPSKTPEPDAQTEQKGWIAPPAPADTAAPRYEMVEILIPIQTTEPDVPPRTLTEDSPEVKAALAEMDIAIYAQPGAPDALEAQEFLAHNQLKYSVHDTTDAMEQERARRLGGTVEGTVIVVDGQILHGYSNERIQELLLTATKKRVVPEKCRALALAGLAFELTLKEGHKDHKTPLAGHPLDIDEV